MGKTDGNDCGARRGRPRLPAIALHPQSLVQILADPRPPLPPHAGDETPETKPPHRGDEPGSGTDFGMHCKGGGGYRAMHFFTIDRGLRFPEKLRAGSNRPTVDHPRIWKSNGNRAPRPCHCEPPQWSKCQDAVSKTEMPVQLPPGVRSAAQRNPARHPDFAAQQEDHADEERPPELRRLIGRRQSEFAPVALELHFQMLLQAGPLRLA